MLDVVLDNEKVQRTGYNLVSGTFLVPYIVLLVGYIIVIMIGYKLPNTQCSIGDTQILLPSSVQNYSEVATRKLSRSLGSMNNFYFLY